MQAAGEGFVMSGRLASRRILITGAASGLGREIARLFARAGAALALLDRHGDGVRAGSAGLAQTVEDSAEIDVTP